VGEAQIWVAAAYAGIDQLEKSGFDTGLWLVPNSARLLMSRFNSALLVEIGFISSPRI